MNLKIIFLSVLTMLTLTAQDGSLVNIKIHAVSIERNLVEESPDLKVGV